MSIKPFVSNVNIIVHVSTKEGNEYVECLNSKVKVKTYGQEVEFKRLCRK